MSNPDETQPLCPRCVARRLEWEQKRDAGESVAREFKSGQIVDGKCTRCSYQEESQ